MTHCIVPRLAFSNNFSERNLTIQDLDYMVRTYTNNLMASPEDFGDEIGLARIWFAVRCLGLGARYHRSRQNLPPRRLGQQKGAHSMNERAMREYTRWAERVTDPELAEQLAAMKGDEKAIEDAFFQDLEFGTAGLRGVLGAGSNRMNVYTVALATQGLANYLKANFDEPGVVICRDSRHKCELFCRVAAEVLAANGVAAHLYPRLEPTPACSFATRDLGCSAGINITASHNPAEYNGYKVYGADGCQITLEVAAKILAAIEAVDCFAVQPADFDAALAEGKIEYSSEKCLDDFVDAVYAQRVGDGAGTADLKLVYTPLNGSGLECVKKLLAKLGVTHVTVVPEQEKPDGSFPTCPYPNPEIREAMQKGLELCDKVHPDLLLGTDPDCDRCGTAVPDGKGGYRLITGNEMGIILLDYICRTRKALGTMPEHPVAVTTIVSTDMATPVAAKYGVELRRTLTGFKFIGEQIGLLEAAGEADRYIFGFEESYGYLSGAHVRDKDAVNATLLVCEAAAWYAKQGMTLLDAINKLYAEFGCYRNALHSFAFEGESGMHTMDAIMKQLRQTPPTAIGGMTVESVVDYNAAGTGLPKANVLEFRLAGGAKLMVRPSGTEPKIKVYLSAVASTEEAADAINDTLGKAAAALLKA